MIVNNTVWIWKWKGRAKVKVEGVNETHVKYTYLEFNKTNEQRRDYFLANFTPE